MAGQDLLDLARESSPDKRNALLKSITDAFFAPKEERNVSESVLFEEVVLRVLRDVETAGRAEFADSVAELANVPRRVIMGLARDEIAVARKVLESSPVLRPDDLVRLSSQISDNHLQAISRRESLPQMVTDSLLQHGSDLVYRLLAENAGAIFSVRGLGQMVERSRQDEVVHQRLSQRTDLPERVVRSLAAHLSDKLDASLKTIGVDAGAGIAPKLLEALQARLTETFQDREREAGEIDQMIADIRGGRSSVDIEISRLASGNRAFDIATVLSQLTDVDHTTAMLALTGAKEEPIVVLFRALDVSWETFELILQLRAKRHRRTYVRSKALAQTYAEMTQPTARRVLKFLQLRRSVAADVA